jgi:hypothetical protein
MLVGLDLPVIAAGFDEKHRVGAGALLALDDFRQAEGFFVGEEVLVGVVDF